jgi:hypothetical protein
MTKIYVINGDVPELVKESHLRPRAALMAYHHCHKRSKNIVHIGGSVFACVTAKGLFYARKSR